MVGDHTDVDHCASAMNPLLELFGARFRFDSVWRRPDLASPDVTPRPHALTLRIPRIYFSVGCSLDLLGESVLHAEEAQRACRTYLDLLERIHSAKANANVSVKLTQMGLDIDEQLCVGNMRAIIGKAKQYDSFVRIDMEQSSYTAKTLELFTNVLYPEFGNTVGVVLQSYLRRTAADLKQAVVTYRDLLRVHQDRINRLNVYPVPDGDTGTNMALTLESVVV